MTEKTTVPWLSAAMAAAILAGLWIASRGNYLLFHTVTEMFSVLVSGGIFVIAWNARRFPTSPYLLFIGIAHLCVGGVDLLHTMAYKGMGVFPGNGPNLPTQLWITARYLQSISLLMAPLLIGRTFRPAATLAAYLVVTATLIASIFGGIFPPCFEEGVGLTPFKIGSEYFISLTFLAALAFLRRKREFFDRRIVNILSAAIVLMAMAELAFTIYVDVYGLSNLVGHLLKVAAVFLIYKGTVETSLTRPYDLLFRELKESEEKFAKAFHTAPTMMVITSLAEGKYLEVNEAFENTLGWRREEVLGRTSREMGIWVDQEQRDQIMGTIEKGEKVLNLEVTLRKKQGETIEGLYSAVGIELDNRKCLLGIVRDVTARRRAEREVKLLNAELTQRAKKLEDTNCELEATVEQLEAVNQEMEAANKELEAFSYTVSHDLRSPLTNINGAAQVIQELFGRGLDPQCRRLVDIIHRETLRMNRLIDTLLRFAHISRGELSPETVDLSALAKEVAGELQAREPQRQASFAIAGNLTTHGDPRLMRIILDNLLGNAWKYTGTQEEAHIEFGAIQGGKPVFFLRDNGVGFDMADAHRLFVPFERLDSGAAFRGEGIGLATVARIVQRHGGRIWAEGEKGKGATFYFSL
ncbi:PAS domain S-box protein [Geobacter hydrogenophilus]|uniref:histidine kinase n=1 Tax=Geobacter hydrogenophilus TaxID=40983 RepID=A0A9W6LDI2_9BACT|nr:MASE3 domain-containing protein [Geobacter hydrogenophilus]MBT0892782.1 PAS domain S-box protein [Geobacter hydrogenophilus]GLI38744.1 PAS domain-containing sensor histidine kinase [Geobacter hydrogenophilus]